MLLTAVYVMDRNFFQIIIIILMFFNIIIINPLEKILADILE